MGDSPVLDIFSYRPGMAATLMGIAERSENHQPIDFYQLNWIVALPPGSFKLRHQQHFEGPV
jgi:hypothetical protein